MKQTKYISLLFILAAFLFTACSDGFSTSQNGSQNPQNQGCIITGGIDINANAAPSQIQSESTSRMATAGSNGSFYINCPDSTVTAVHVSTNYKIPGIVKEVENGYAYSITIPASGDWIILVTAISGSVVYCGQAMVTVEDYSRLELEEPAPDICLFPTFKEGETGTINLKVWNDMPTTSSTNPYTVKMVWSGNIPSSVSSELDDDNAKTVSMPSTHGSESEAFFFEDVPAGAYKVEFQFLEDEKLFYTCEQWIHVFGGMTTDAWYGDVDNDYKYINSNHKTWLALTQEEVADYAITQPRIFPKNTLLYSYNTANQLKIKKIQNNNYQSSSQINTTEAVDLPEGQTASNQNLKNVFCYQDDGVTYIAGHAVTPDSTHYEIVYKLGADSTTATPYCYSKIQIPDTNYDEEFSIEALYVEPHSNVVYGMTHGKFGAGTYFPKLFAYNPTVENTKTQFFESSIRTHQKVSCFILKDGYVYVPDYNSGKLTINCYFINFDKLEEIPSKSRIIELGVYGLNHNVQITDMICIGENIYILLNEYYNGLSLLYSRGMVIKYNLEAKTMEQKGLTNETEAEVQYYCSGRNDEIVDLFEDSIQTGPGFEYTIKMVTSIYFPQNPEEKFYGPQKILSYDDSYLYIADSGNNYILTGNDNDITFEPVNRVIKVNIHDDEMNLEEVINVDGSVRFTIPQTTIFISDPVTSDSTQVYDDDGNPYTTKYLYIKQNQ